MSDWRTIETADQNTIKPVILLGHYPDSSEIIAVQGMYDSGGWTEGWADYRMNEFYATHWMPLPKPPD